MDNFFLLSVCLTTGATALELAFPESIPAAETFSVAWAREKGDPSPQFFLQKHRFDSSGNTVAISTPFPVPNSDQDGGIAPLAFAYAGHYGVFAVESANTKTFFSTEITVITNPTSTGGPKPSITTPPIPSIGNNDGSVSGNEESGQISTKSSTPSSTIPSSASAFTGNATLDAKSTHSDEGVIIGCTVGGVVLALICALLLFYRRRRRRHRAASEQSTGLPVPFVLSPKGRERSRNVYDVDSQGTDTDSGVGGGTLFSQKARGYASVGDRGGRKVKRFGVPHSHSSSGVSEKVASNVTTAGPSYEVQSRALTSVAGTTIGSLVSSGQPPTLTERQVQIQEEADQLRQQILALVSSNDSSLREMMNQIVGRIRVLEVRAESDWARGLTDEPPPGYVEG